MKVPFRVAGAVGVWLLTLIAWDAHLLAAPKALSTRAIGASLPAVGNGNSVSPLLSPDGRFVLFASSASDLVSNDNGLLFVDVFLRDRMSKSTVLVSANFSNLGGGSGNSRPLGVSTNGRFVVFESDATDLLPGDTNGFTDVFVRDLLLGTNLLVSVTTAGGFASGESTDAVMTPDGRYVAFVSLATNLVAGDTNGIKDVFVRDLVAGTTVRASAGAVSGAKVGGDTPVITPDGRYLAFFSSATGLVAGVTSTRGEIYVRDLVAVATAWASTNAAAIALATLNLSNVPSSHPSISDDGRYVAFKTGSSNGVNTAVVLRHDLLSGLTTLVDANAFPAPAFGDDFYGPEMTADGGAIVFVGRPITNQLYANVQVWNATGGTSAPVSVATNGIVPTNTISHSPVITRNGRFVTFLSSANSLTTNAVSNGFHVYLRDLFTGTTQLVDADPNGIGSSDAEGTYPRPSDDGRYVTFCSPDGQLVGLDRNFAFDVFVRDASSNRTELISLRNPALIPQTSSGISSMGQLAFSADGRWLAFASLGDDLILNDTNRAQDVFVHDLVAGTNILVSAGTNGVPALGGSSSGPAISADGRFVTFVSPATNLVAYPFNPFQRRNQIYFRSLSARTNILVSVASDGVTPGTGDSASPVISEDGHFVAFLSSSINLVPGPGSGSRTFRRDTIAGVTVSLAGASVSTLPPSMSADGRYVAYSADSQVRVWDAQLAANVYTNTGPVVSFALSPTGTKLAYQVSSTIFVADIISKSNLLSHSSSAPIQSAAQWSTDGRFFAFVSAASLVTGDNNITNDVYLRDTASNALMLVSVRLDHTGSASGPSDFPAVSWDGRFVVFRSFATNLVPGNAIAPPNLFVFDRFSGSNSLLTLKSPVPNWTSWLTRPAVGAEAHSVAFLGWSPLGTNDFNRLQDVFASEWETTDSDGDGMDDAWERHYFGSLLRNGSLDFDQDGASDLAEFLAGTDPANSASGLRLEIAPLVSGSGFALSWSAVPGRSYRVQSKADLNDPLWSDVSDVLVPSTRGYLNLPANQTARYYRLLDLN